MRSGCDMRSKKMRFCRLAAVLLLGTARKRLCPASVLSWRQRCCSYPPQAEELASQQKALSEMQQQAQKYNSELQQYNSKMQGELQVRDGVHPPCGRSFATRSRSIVCLRCCAVRGMRCCAVHGMHCCAVTQHSSLRSSSVKCHWQPR